MLLNATPNPMGVGYQAPAETQSQAEQIALSLGKSANTVNKDSEAIIASYKS